MSTFSLLEGRDPLLSIELAHGEKVIAESNAMVMHDGGVSIEGGMNGGVMSALFRSVANNESFFVQNITGINPRGLGNIMLAPQLPGDIHVLDVSETESYFINEGCFMASDASVDMTNQLNSSLGSALFGDTGGFVVMKTKGRGKVAVSGFGQIIVVDVNPGEEIVIDNGHLVAWSEGLTHELSTASSRSGMFGRLLSTATSGEFAVLKFRGKGKILVASRNQKSFETYIQSFIPAQ
jgi:uncharacterized protein (TIGR00266 family)